MKKNLKKWLIVAFSIFGTLLYSQPISSYFPNSGAQGQTIPVTITAAGNNFFSSTGASVASLSDGINEVLSSSLNIINSEECIAYFNIPPNITPGNYILEVVDYTFGNNANFQITGVVNPQAYFLVKGRVYVDVNSNCNYNFPDYPIAQRGVSIGGYYTITDNNGEYELWVPVGTHTASIYLRNNSEQIVCPGGNALSVSSFVNNDTIWGVDFAVDTIQYNDIRPVITASIWRPGFSYDSQLILENLGTVFMPTAQLYLYSPPGFYSNAMSPPPTSCANDTCVWTITNIAPGNRTIIHLDDSLSANTPLGTFLNRKTWIKLPVLDDNPPNDTMNSPGIVSGSYDPNDKKVYNTQGFEIEKFVPSGDSVLQYKIRFQNTGTDTAFNIFVRDTLDPQFEMVSFRTLAASHNYTVALNGRGVQWAFMNILLEDSNHNEPESHGYILFEIKYNSALPQGTAFHNKASIYFDYNAPVVTNETETIICNPVTGSYTSAVAGLNVTFAGSSPTATSWEWDFGDGTTSTQQNPTHTYNASGSYNVCLVVTNACSRTDTICNPVVACGATANATFGQNPIAALQVAFNDQTAGSPVAWTWDFGDGTSSTQQNPSHTYANPGTYTVCLVITDVCNGMDTTCQTVVVTCPPISPAFSASTSNLSATFTNSTASGTSGFLWNFGDGNTSTQANPSHTYSAPGTYNVCLIALSACGNDTLCQNVVVNCNVIPAAFATTTSSLFATFTNSTGSGTTGFLWNFGDGNTSTQANPSHTYSAPGTYNVCLIALSACGNDTLCQNVVVNCNVIPAAFATTTTSNLSATFTNSTASGTTGFLWSFGDGNTSTQANPSHTYSAPGTYNVCLIALSACGNDTLCQNVIVNCTAIPAAFASSPAGLIVTFSNTTASGTNGFLWNFGDGTTSTLANPTHTYSSQGTFTVCLVALSACGNDTLCQTLNLSCATPAAAFGFAPGALGWDFTDQSTNSPTSWFWDFGDGGSSIQQNPTNHLFPQPGTYTVCLLATNPCGTDTSCQTLLITSVGDVTAEDLRVFPNPTEGSLNVAGTTQDEVEISLLDLTGRVVLVPQKVSQPGAFNLRFNTAELPAGIYMVKVSSLRGTQFLKVTKL